MAKKIENLTKEGLPGQIYYYCFSKPKTIYEISKTIYGKAQPQKLYPWKDKLLEEGYLKTVDGKFLSTCKPILEEINERLKKQGKSLENGYYQYLDEWLDKSFRTYRVKFASAEDVISGLETLIIELDIFFILYKNTFKSFYLKHPQLKIKNLFDYNHLISKFNADNKQKISDEVRKTMQSYKGISATIDPDKLKFVFIPEDLLDLLIGVSSVGRKYGLIADVLNEMIDALNFVSQRYSVPRNGFRM